MAQRKIVKKTITVETYVGSDGKETPVSEMADRHLLKALMVNENEGNSEVVEVLGSEALRRMKK